MKLATWNVNSLKVRLPQVLAWLEANPVDCLCLQETKLTDERFPAAELKAIGYEAAWYGQPTYNGVALLWPERGTPASDLVRGNPQFSEDHRRVIAASFGEVRVVCIYVPNGQAVGSDKYDYKLRWLDAFYAWMAQETQQHRSLAILGDFNIAPEDADVHDPKAWEAQVLCSAPERERFNKLLGLGLQDAFRLFEQTPRSFSWWDYRQLAFRRNAGLRIDHILVTQALAEQSRSCWIDRSARKHEQPSDHAPVVLELA